MNRKSSGLSLRKSIRPRESQLPGSAGVPSSARRGFANRTILDSTRSSIGGRLSLYGGQVAQKDSRQFSDEFIQGTFRRLRNFFVQHRMDAEIVPLSSKLTLRQFETLFLKLYHLIDEHYNHPPGNNWMEIEVPILMDFLGYPIKVTKSILQTVSSKPGPVVGILDFLLDLAVNTMCDSTEAIGLLQRDEDPLQIGFDELSRSTFTKGIAVNNPELKGLVSELCRNQKGIVDADSMQEELAETMHLKTEAESRLQQLEDQVAEKANVDEECADHENFIEQMRSRRMAKDDELGQVREQATLLMANLESTKKIISKTKEIVDAQPISQEDIKIIRARTSDFREELLSLQTKIRDITAQIDRTRSSIRVEEAEAKNICSLLTQSIQQSGISMPGEMTPSEMVMSKEAGTLIDHLTSEFEKLNKQICANKNKNEEILFDLEQKMNRLETVFMTATQDKEALDQKLDYFNSRLTEKRTELLSRQGVLKNYDNRITFLDKELEDLKLQEKRSNVQLGVARSKLRKARMEYATMKLYVEKCHRKISDTIAVDQKRTAEIIKMYDEEFDVIPLRAIMDKLSAFFDHPVVSKFVEASEELPLNQ